MKGLASTAQGREQAVGLEDLHPPPQSWGPRRQKRALYSSSKYL